MGANADGRWSYSRLERVLQTQATLRARHQALPVRGTDRARGTGTVLDAGEAGALVATELDVLPHPWRTLHVLDADAGERRPAIAIGPPGVFSVTTLTATTPTVVHDRAIVVAGRATDAVNQARRAADLTGRRLTRALGRAVPVTPVVAVVGTPLEHVGAPRAMIVTDAHALGPALRTHAPTRYRTAEVAELVRAATSPEMWDLH